VKEHIDFVLQWAAYPIQNPGAKLFQDIIIWGPQGSGKNLWAEMIMRLYGEHGIVITDKELESDYNSWIRAKQFIIGDEICKGDRRAFSNTRKGLVTGETVKVNEKFQPLVVLPNLANFVFLSNDATPMYLEGDDRRGFVVDVPDARELGFYQRIWDWYESGGKAALLCYLMHNVSCEKFNPKANAPMTEAKMDMIDRGRVASERVLHYMKDDIDMSKPLRTSGEILVSILKFLSLDKALDASVGPGRLCSSFVFER
jgi:putative DNA primase/helicase